MTMPKSRFFELSHPLPHNIGLGRDWCFEITVFSDRQPPHDCTRSFAGAATDLADEFFRRLVPNGDRHWSNPLVQNRGIEKNSHKRVRKHMLLCFHPQRTGD